MKSCLVVLQNDIIFTYSWGFQLVASLKFFLSLSFLTSIDEVIRMENFIQTPSFLQNFISFNLILNPKVKRKKFLISFVVFVVHNINLALLGATTCLTMLHNLDSIDNALGTFMVIMLTSVISVKYLAAYHNRVEIQKLIKNFKKLSDFSPNIQNKFKAFERLRKIYFGYTCMSAIMVLCVSLYRAFNGITAISAFARFSNNLDNKFISLSIMFWSCSVQVSGLFMNFMTDILNCKLTFVMAMEFKELAKSFRALKWKNCVFESVKTFSEPFLVGRRSRSAEIYPNLLSKFEMKVRGRS